MTETPTSVYQYRDSNGVLIYVGITCRDTRRQKEHGKNAEWWPFAVSQSIEHYKDRHEAEVRESQLILLHRPPFNRQYNPAYERLRHAYLTLFQPHALNGRRATGCGHCGACLMDDADAENYSEESFECNGLDHAHLRIQQRRGEVCPHCGMAQDACLWWIGFVEGRIAGYMFDLERRIASGEVVPSTEGAPF